MAYVIAHRANGSEYPENTKEAILKVLSFPYVDGVEIDVQMTKDRKFVLHHNSMVICKNKKVEAIHNTSYKKIGECKKLPLLEEVLKETGNKKIIFLDLKIGKRKKIYMKYLVRLLRKCHYNQYIMSFDYNFVKELKKKNQNLKVGFLKGYFLNEEKKRENLDFCIVSYKQYKNEEGIYTVNKKDIFLKYQNKDIFIITDHPEFNK